MTGEGNKLDFEITEEMNICHLGIPEQVGLGEVTYTDKTNVMPNDVDIDFNVEAGLRNWAPTVRSRANSPTAPMPGAAQLRADNEGMPVGFTVD